MDIATTFAKLKPAREDGSMMVHDPSTGVPIFQAGSLPSLIQALGYVKFTHRGKRIFYRGQHHLHCGEKDSSGNYLFQPALFRGTGRDAENRTGKLDHLQKLIAEIRKNNPRFKSAKKFEDKVLEGLLQQYGIATSWFDVVDNIWVALWFACFRIDNTIKILEGTEAVQAKREFIHMIRRNPKKEREKTHQEPFAYIFLLGETNDNRTEILDLREKIPSDFIRPHVQHGLLIRLLSKHGKPAPNMFPLVYGIVAIRLDDALEWMGQGGILTPENMMPPPNYDSGFRQLLNSENDMPEEMHCHFPLYV